MRVRAGSPMRHRESKSDKQAQSLAELSSPASKENVINQELRRLKRALRALSACSRALAQAASEQELLDQICDVMVRLGGYRMAGIALAEADEEKNVRPVAHAGHDSGYLAKIPIKWSDTPAGRGPAGTAIRENRICVITDTATDPQFAPWRDAALQRGYAALIALPLRLAGRVFGVLAIYSEQRGSFESSEVELLEEIAENLSYGVTAIRAQAESKRAGAALRDAEAKYRQLVEILPAISYVAETGLRSPFLYLSPQLRTILGYAPEECVGDPLFWWNHLNPEDRAIAQMEDTWEQGRPFQIEYRMRSKDGREVWIRDEALIFPDPATGERLTRGLMIDITERKRAEDALRESEARYRMFVEQSSEGIYCIDYAPPVPCDLPMSEQLARAHANGYVAECNDAMAKMYGRSSAEEMRGKRLSELLVLRDPVTQEFMENFIQSGYRISDQESREVDAHGENKILRSTMTGTVIDGHWVRTWGISRDVTERIQLEEQLRNAQQLEAIGRLAGGVAHDFNNILGVIIGHCELVSANPETPVGTRDGLDQIRKAADRAASLTQQLLAFSRKQVLRPRTLNLNEVVTGVKEMLMRVIGEDIELIARLHRSLVPVKADQGRVEQVLMNLAVNARDAMPQGGKLTMETANAEVPAEQARDLDLVPGTYVMLTVADTGQGMDAATLPHIFEPFFTTKPMGKGTGLGLATVYGIVKQSGGSIVVKTEVDRGTEFRIYLPAGAGEMGKVQSVGGKVVGGRETVLIVEDEPGMRELTSVFLEGYGYRVLAASGPEQAIEIAEAFSEPIDLLLTDVIMPGMSGRKLAEKIVSVRPKTKIVYMTGYTDDMVVQHKVLEPGVRLLQKPFTKLDLALKVRATLDGK
jgi:two-component system cell cycle sensor histidine kinase/response regulator CckA